MRKFNKVMLAGVLCSGLVHFANATDNSSSQDETVWNFSSHSDDYTSTSSGVGNAYVLNDNGLTLTISSWADNGYHSSITQSELFRWDGGIGAQNTSEGGSPQHAVDNNGSRDMLLFSFSEMVALESLSLGWAYEYNWNSNNWETGADITVAALGNSLPTLSGNTWSGIENLGIEATSYANFTTGHINSNNSESKYWLIGAYNSLLDPAGYSDHNDFVKIAGLTTHTSSSGGPVVAPSVANAPSSLAIFSLAISGVWLRRRRK